MKIAFYWENFGPTHVDRCEAVANCVGSDKVHGIELRPRSAHYEWRPERGQSFSKSTLLETNRRINWLSLALKLTRTVMSVGATHVFLCHHNVLGVESAAVLLRLAGKKVYLLTDSKFDDLPRSAWREAGKSLWLLPYDGAIAGSRRTRQYLRFLGLRDDKIASYYDTISLSRIRSLAAVPLPPDGPAFETRHFTIVARLIPKKNLFAAIDAFSLYAASVQAPRKLRIFGNGELENQLRDRASERGVAHLVSFEGFQQTEAICRALGSTLALLHVSKEEQFGLAIIEALAMGVPVIVSDNCGARDEFVRSGQNGFVVEPDNSEGMAFFLRLVSSDKTLWERLSRSAISFAEQADARQFAASVLSLTGATRVASKKSS